MTASPDPVLQAVLDAATSGTAGTAGWLLAVRGEQLEVMATSGTAPGSVVGALVPAETGTAGFVVGSGQPVALAVRPDDARAAAGVPELVGRRPVTNLCVPCDSSEGIAGALEVIDKAGGATFTFDDVELATLLAGIAGAALAAGGVGQRHVPTPAQLAADLERLRDVDAARYAAVASVVVTLVADG